MRNGTECMGFVVYVQKFHELVKDTKKKKDEEDPGTDWDWREDWMLVGSDVVSLFPSLTAETTAKIVRKQVRKSPITWMNVDVDWLRLYIHLNRSLASDISSVEELHPRKRKGRRGVESGMHSQECLQRHIHTDTVDSCWT